MAGERLESCLIAATGLEGDRRWALVDGTPNRAGKLFTNTQDARLMRYGARLAGQTVEVVTPVGETRGLDDVLVAELAAQTSRPLTLRDAAGLNYDDSHVLVVNLNTVAAFELSAGVQVDRRRFRANLYLDGLEPEEKIRWAGRRIGPGVARAASCPGGDERYVHGRLLQRRAARDGGDRRPVRPGTKLDPKFPIG